MIRNFTLILLACMGLHFLSFGQQAACGFDKIHRLKMQTDPQYAASVNQFNAGVASWIAQQQSLPQSLVTTFNGNQAWEIPVVVHVVHTGQAVGTTFNPSATVITNFVNYLSQAFTASYTGHLLESSGGTRIPIVFKLAQRAPNCVASTGIVRYDLSSNATYAADGVGSPGVPDATLKTLVPGWPSTEYYNIWIVTEIDGKDGTSGQFTAGYAYFPQPAAFATDGTVVLATQTSVGNSVITHELGHAFDLYHVFEDDDPTSSGPPYVCPTPPGDFVADTEPMKRSLFNCPAEGTNTCNPPGNLYNNTQRNFMDYSNCKDRFTPGQRVRVWNALMSTFNPTTRSSLISSLGATALGTPVAAASCNPTGTGASNLGPRAVTIIKTPAVSSPSVLDTFIMNAISGSVTTDGGLHWFDRTCQHRAELKAGQAYRFRVTVGGTTENIRAWIDYNNDGTFGLTEQVFAATGSNTLGFQNFTVPAVGAVNCTPLRMRVITNTGSIPGPCQTNIVGQAEDYEVIIRGSNTGSTTTGLVNTYIPSTYGNPSCLNSYVEVHATASTTITPVWYQWFRKTTSGSVTAGPSSATDSVWGSTVFTDLDTVWVRLAYPGICGIDTTLDSVTLYRPVTVAPSVTIGVTGGTNPTCVDDTVTLSVTGTVNSGGSYFQWYKNGVAIVPTALGNTYKVIGGTSGDIYTARMIFPVSAQNACNGFTPFVTSNQVAVTQTTKPPTASVALISGTNPGCAGQLYTYSASGTVLGSNPSYQWKINGTNAGTNSPVFSTFLNNSDIVSVVITSSSPCAAAPTASIAAPAIVQTTIIADVTIAQLAGDGCSGHPHVFSATPVNAGTGPQFQWLINNTPVPGANSPIFTTTSLLNNDIVSCILVSTDPCVSNTFDTSNIINMAITTSKVPSVTIALTAGNNPGCLDSLVEFTATPTNIGTSPKYEWFVNNFPLSLNNPVYSSTNLLNNDVVFCRVTQTDGGCYLPDSADSQPVTLVRSKTPEPPIISLIGNMLVTNKAGSFVWFGPGGQLTGGTDGKYHPLELGQYWCVTNNNGCYSRPSNKLTITLLDINTLNTEPASIYPNPTTGMLTIDWGHNVNMQVDVYSTIGKKLLHDEVNNQSHKVIDLSQLANGIYFVVMSDEQGGSATARVTVTR